MLPQEIIRRKRDGHKLSAPEIAAFIEGITAGTLSEGQIGAFAMAVFLKGMSREEGDPGQEQIPKEKDVGRLPGDQNPKA